MDKLNTEYQYPSYRPGVNPIPKDRIRIPASKRDCFAPIQTDVHLLLKAYAQRNNVTITDTVNRAILEYLVRHTK